MILSRGIIYDNKFQEEQIEKVYEYSLEAIRSKIISPEKLAEACGKLAEKALNHEFDAVAKPLLDFAQIPYETFEAYCRMFTKERILNKFNIELSGYPLNETQVSEHLYRKTAPLGILLHIAAGNVDVLPAYSVIEGLLAGNVNILKLPSGDSGLSVKLLFELIKEYPDLADFIYVFDVPSIEIATIKKLAHISDAVVIWGGDMAVKAAHDFIEPNTKLICWGHKISFAYADIHTSHEMLRELANDICKTNQLYCSSAQGIYLDTEDDSEIKKFAETFFEILKEANRDIGKAPIGMRGKNKLSLYCDSLEGRDCIFDGEGVSVSVKSNNELELSYMFRNVWIKKLPSSEIISVLKCNKGHLQSCALLIDDIDKRDYLSELFIKAGITRITYGTLSNMLFDEAHDGVFPLKEYSKIVDIYRS